MFKFNKHVANIYESKLAHYKKKNWITRHGDLRHEEGSEEGEIHESIVNSKVIRLNTYNTSEYNWRAREKNTRRRESFARKYLINKIK